MLFCDGFCAFCGNRAPPADVRGKRTVKLPRMTQADRIRKFVLDHYVSPARTDGRAEIIIRAGDVHQAMGLRNAMPAVCSAIGSNKFDEIANVTRGTRTGPANGANVYFQFDLGARRSAEALTVPAQEREHRRVQPSSRGGLDLGGAVALVSCVKSKRPNNSPARSLYTSAWFQKVRNIVEASGVRWFVLSSRYGLVAPDAEIAPYDYTLNTLGVAERRAWANGVLNKLLPELAGENRVVMFAGQRYREFLVEPLRERGIKVEIPMANLTRGEQLAWLSQN